MNKLKIPLYIFAYIIYIPIMMYSTIKVIHYIFKPEPEFHEKLSSSRQISSRQSK